jgi:NADPH2:quinone reductase
VKAVVCRAYGSPDCLTLEELPEPEPRDDEVVVAVKAARVAFTDILLVSGHYQRKPPFPFSPGGEVAGIVSATGRSVRGLKVGNRVIATPGEGGFRTALAVRENQCIPLPDGVDFIRGCAFVLTYSTSLFALRDRGMSRKEDRLLVLGAASGIGLAAVQIGAVLGMRVTAAASSAARAEFAGSHGAENIVVYPPTLADVSSRKEMTAALMAASGGSGFDVIFDPIGGDYAEPAFRSLAWGGRHVVVGFASSSEIPKISLNLPLMHNTSLIGALWGGERSRYPAHDREVIEQVMTWLKDKSIKPEVSKVLPLERAVEALREIASRKALGRIVLTVD